MSRPKFWDRVRATRLNRCDVCGKFKKWEALYLHFVPDTAFSSENESYRECADCADERARMVKTPVVVAMETHA